MLVGRLRTGQVAVFCCVSGYGRRWASPTMVLPTCWTPFPVRTPHASLVWCWPARVRSVDGRVVVSAAVALVQVCVRRLMVGLFAVGSFALQPALVQPDVVPVVASAVSVLIGSAVVGLCSSRCVRLLVVLGHRVGLRFEV